MESLLERNNSILKNENLKPDLGKVCFDNSIFKEEDYNSQLNLSRNHLNESLDDRKSKLLMKSMLSNEMSNNYDYSQQKIINKFDKSEIFSSCKSSKYSGRVDVSNCSSKSKNLSKFLQNHSIFNHQIQKKPEIINLTESISPQIHFQLDLNGSNKSLVEDSKNKNFKDNKSTLKKKALKKNIFESLDQEINYNSVKDVEFVTNMINSEKEYVVEPNFLLKHDNIKVEYRSLLIDWIMELCEEFAYKRDTFHNSVNYLDRYFSYCDHIEKEELQLIGCVCLAIAAKFEVNNKIISGSSDTEI